MIMIYAFAGVFVLSVIFSKIVIKIAKKFDITDKPIGPRKIHKNPMPLMGGLAIFASFFIVVFLVFFISNDLLGDNILPKYLYGLFVAGLLIMIGGVLDDKYNLSPAKQLVWPILAAITVIISGIGFNEITNPFGGVINLNFWEINIFSTYKFVFVVDVFIFLWLMGMMYTTKLLDGLDGLVTGIGAIGSIVIFLLTITTKFYQPDTALLAIIFVGACLGFLLFNFNPAKSFLGEGGSLFIGFILGVLAIISGGKIATALLIMGIPILDAGWVILRRLFEGKSPFKTSDRKHLHHRLLDLGMSQRKAVLFLYFLSAGFGVCTLFLQSKSKLIALGVLFLLMIIIGLAIVKAIKKEK